MSNPVISASPGTWAQRFAQLTQINGLSAAALALLGSYGTGFGLWAFTTGFLFVGGGIALAILAVILGLVALWLGRGTSLPKRKILVGLICALGLLSVIGYWFNRAVSVPMIHDVTTNLASPPAFTKLKLRDDNLVGVVTEDKWRAEHAKAYSDLAPMLLPIPPAEAIRRAERIVRARGWEVALVTPDRIEATETASPFAFKDDVVIVAELGAGGAGSVVNVRSVSRVGISDLGVNAERIKSLLVDLRAAEK